MIALAVRWNFMALRNIWRFITRRFRIEWNSKRACSLFSFLPSILHSIDSLISISGISNWYFVPMRMSLCSLFLSFRSIPTPWNRLTRWTFYVWYLLRARLGSGFIESYIKASGPEKAKGVERLARAFANRLTEFSRFRGVSPHFFRRKLSARLL